MGSKWVLATQRFSHNVTQTSGVSSRDNFTKVLKRFSVCEVWVRSGRVVHRALEPDACVDKCRPLLVPTDKTILGSVLLLGAMLGRMLLVIQVPACADVNSFAHYILHRREKCVRSCNKINPQLVLS